MERNTERFSEGREAGLHGLMAWDTDSDWLAGWISGHDEVEEVNIRAQLAAQRRARATA